MRLLVFAVLAVAVAACGKTSKPEPGLELKEEPVAGYAISVPEGAESEVATTTPGEPSSRVFRGGDLVVEVMVADKSGPLNVTTLDLAVKSIPPAGMARPTEQVELSKTEFMVINTPAVGMAEAWVWRQGKTRFVRAHCRGPDTKLSRLKEMCTSLRTID